VTLNSSGDTSPSTDAERQRVAAEVLDEMTSWNPRERSDEFRTWLAGSLSLVHLHVLNVLEADGPLSMSRLAESLDVSVASATGIVDRLEQRGLVERRRETDDRRVIVVHRTAAGEAVFSDLAQRRRAGLSRLLAEFSDEELAATLVGLRAMRRGRAALLAEHRAATARETGANR
jgi:DNA-binding MarR family transcriptional regulator